MTKAGLTLAILDGLPQNQEVEVVNVGEFLFSMGVLKIPLFFPQVEFRALHVNENVIT